MLSRSARVAAVLCALLAALPLLTATSRPAVVNASATRPVTKVVAQPHVLTANLIWSQNLSDQGCPVAESSPTLANLDGQPAAVVGDRAGFVYAYHLSDGSPVTGWPAAVPGAAPCVAGSSECPHTVNLSNSVPVDSTPSVSGPPGAQTVYVGSGNAACPGVGGYQALAANGSLQWFTSVNDPVTDEQPAQGVQASLTVAPLVGAGPDVVAGSLDQQQYAIAGNSHGAGSVLRGWPFFDADSVFSTAAVGDLYGTGHDEIVEGGDSSAGFGRGQNYGAGGHLRILNANGGQICRADANQTMDSSPAIGGFLPGGATGIVMGTGSFYAGASDSNTVRAYDTHCHLAWVDWLDGSTFSSPALADLTGDGGFDVAEGTDTATGGSVWAIAASSGAVVWQKPAIGRVIGSITTADLTGAGHQDLLVPTTAGMEMMDGTTGDELGVLGSDLGFQNSALVTDDPSGALGITVAGYNGNDEGVVRHYEIAAVDGSLATEAGAWPEFHHDPQLTGNAGGTTPRGSVPRCQVPSGVIAGYDQVASDGGVFAFGTPFCGSTGAMRLNAPVVAMAQSPAVGGYWLVASDGGVFAYGGAHFFGSTGARHLQQPIIGMAATPSGRGYWLVASDGGIFAFGDAGFYGSTGGMMLPSPVVGMAATGDGRGYRLVTASGGVYDFGDAQFFGSLNGVHLAAPVTGVAADLDTGGYWLVCADGGLFTFDAPYFGSAGNLHLARPIVGIAAWPSAGGYRLTASDGGVFSYGGAPFLGSTGGHPLHAPVVGISGT
jgi:hypothetical protein